MFILGLEFLALIVICYVFFVYATSNHVSGRKEKLNLGWVVGIIAFMLLSMILFASWYVRLGLSS